MKRLLVPAYRPARHSFLMRRWWFRLFLVVYVPFILLWGPVRWVGAVETAHNNCVATLTVSVGNGTPDFYRALSTCNDVARDAWTWPGVLWGSLLPPLLLHFIGQWVLFRVIVDFVVLGGKREAESGA